MRKFTVIDEEFECENCGKQVPKLGYSCRNHCPYCLHSKHVDVNPGDRSEKCHGSRSCLPWTDCPFAPSAGAGHCHKVRLSRARAI